MMRLRFLLAVVTVLAASASGYAQTEIKANQPVHGVLTKPNQTDTWTIVLDRQVDTLQIEAECKSARLLLRFFERDRVQTYTTVSDGQGDTVPGWGVAGNRLIAIADPQKYPALPAGRYTLKVQAQGGQGKGDYTLRVLSPTLAQKQPDTPSTLATTPVATPAEIGRLRDEMAELRARIVVLEKKIAEMDKDKGTVNR